MPLTDTAFSLRTEPLPLATLQVSGADAAAFLQAMLTQDILSLPAGQATRAGLCNAKGRLLTDCLVTRRTADSGYHLTLHASLAEEIRRLLQRYVLRQKVTIEPTQERHEGWIRPTADDCTAHNLPAPVPLHGAFDAVGSFVLWTHRGDNPRLLCFQPATHGSPSANPLVPAEHWDAEEILDGLPQVVAATSGHFVPQWLHLDRLGAISFKKGCYPGQEVIARLHYLGKPNRQLVLGHIDGASAIAPGTLLFSTSTDTRPPAETSESSGQETAAGEVVRSAPDRQHPARQLFLAVLRSSHRHDDLTLNGQPCKIRATAPETAPASTH
ncbi:YgfZ/GcvT domain-containing protein [Halothiobacillus sp. DCM-1]|uniref:CAF17-like 4Fe-4S cluster assembly/insertion protein YgfZ n=1 Tax=Halothiobacillus sp. DCM-1 TaxID=3112558 RepID=UPI00324A3B35